MKQGQRAAFVGENPSFPTYEVVIPAFNARRTIGSTIESVLAQTVAPTSIIVADDGSTDETTDIARRYSGVRVCSFPHGGLSRVQNQALLQVAAEYVAFVDADDVWHPHVAQVVLAAAQVIGAAAVGVAADVFTGPVWPGIARAVPLQFEWHEVELRDQLRVNALAKSGTLFRTAAVCKVGGYSEALTACEDLDLSLKLLEGGYKIAVSPWEGVGLRSATTTLSRSPSMLPNELAVLLPRLRRHPELSERGVRLRARRSWLQTLARAATDRRDLREVPPLTRYVGVGPLQQAFEQIIFSPLAPIIASFWRGYRFVRTLVRA